MRPVTRLHRPALPARERNRAHLVRAIGVLATLATTLALASAASAAHPCGGEHFIEAGTWTRVR